jgi:hypothetical protein
MVDNISEWVGRGTIQVPADTAAAVRVDAPKHPLTVLNER